MGITESVRRVVYTVTDSRHMVGSIGGHMTKDGYNILAALCIIAAVAVALIGGSNADDLLATGLVGLAGTIAGRGDKAA